MPLLSDYTAQSLFLRIFFVLSIYFSASASSTVAMPAGIVFDDIVTLKDSSRYICRIVSATTDELVVETASGNLLYIQQFEVYRIHFGGVRTKVQLFMMNGERRYVLLLGTTKSGARVLVPDGSAVEFLSWQSIKKIVVEEKNSGKSN